MTSREAEQIALRVIKQYLDEHPDAVIATRGREVFMFGPDGDSWVGSIGVFSADVMQRSTLEHGWIDRPQDRAKEWLRVTVSRDGRAVLEEVADWQTL